jgi:hypothetical protein
VILNLLKHISIFFLIIFSAGASTISIDDTSLIIFFILIVFFTIVKDQLRKIFKEVLLIVGLVLCFMIYYYSINGNLDLHTWIGFLLKIFIGFLVVRINGESFSKNLIKVTYLISIVSLAGYILQLFIPDTLFQLNNFFGIALRENSNSLIFNFTYLHAVRNSGCMWEPGAFAALLIIVLWLSYFDGNEISKRIRLIFIITLLTTFSTFGYIVFGVILLFRNLLQVNSSKKFISLLFMFGTFLYLFFNSELLGNKIFEQVSNVQEELNKVNKNPNYQLSITRFASFAIDYPKILKSPLLGYGIDINTTNEKVMYNDYGSNVIRSSGILVIFLQLGFIGFCLYFLILFQTFKKLSNRYYAWATLVIFFLLLFSNPLQFSPLLLSMLFIRMPSNSYGDEELYST